jgi:hypothetical protein
MTNADPDALLRHTSTRPCTPPSRPAVDRYRWFDADYDRRARRYRDLPAPGSRTGAGGGRIPSLLPTQSGHAALAKVFGAEALIRWQHPEEGLLLPAEFMPAADTSDLAIAVGSLGDATRRCGR